MESEIIRLDILCDLDGVGIDLVPPWVARYNREFNDSLDPRSVTDWDIRKFVKPEAHAVIYKILQDPTLYDDAPEVPGFLEAIKTLRAAGHEITFITAANEFSGMAKVAWCRRHGVIPPIEKDPEHADVMIGTKKHKLVAHLLIDDYIGNLDRNPLPGIMFPAPYNLQFANAGYYRPANWEELTEVLLRLRPEQIASLTGVGRSHRAAPGVSTGRVRI